MYPAALSWPRAQPLSPHLRNGAGFTWNFLRAGPPVPASDGTAHAPTDSHRTPKMARLEAALLVANGPLAPRRLAQFATLADATEARTLVRRLNACYDRDGTAFRIEQVAAGYQLLTRPEYVNWLQKLHQRQAELKLSPPAQETLAILAYRQPITRADIEAIRGVGSIEIIKQLLDRGLVRIGGNDDSLGRPHLYETTRRFLEVFGLKSLDDLPLADKLRPARPAAAPQSALDPAA